MHKRSSLTARIDVLPDGKVYLNGTPSPDGSDGTVEQALSSLGTKVVREGLSAVHVMIAYGPGDPRDHLIIGSDGVPFSVGSKEEAYTYTSDQSILISRGNKDRRPGLSRRAFWLSIAGIAPVTAVAAWAIIATSSDDRPKLLDEEPKKRSPRRLNRKPAPGWSASPVWSVDIARGSAPIPSDDGRVAIVSPGRSVEMLDPRSGISIWSSPNPAPEGSSVHLSTIDGQLSVCVRHSSGLTIWPVEGKSSGTHREFPLSRSMNVKYTGSSPLITGSEPSEAWIISEGRVVPVSLPRKSYALSSDDGFVSASTTSGEHWYIPPGGSPSGRVKSPPPERGSSVSRILGAGYGTLAASWSSSRSSRMWVTLDDHSGKRLFSREIRKESSDLRWFRAIGGETVVLGPVVLDTKSGSILVLPEFSPVSGFKNTVYGRRADDMVAASPFGKAQELSKGSAVPWSVLKSGYAIVVDTGKESSSPRVCALRPAED